MRKRHAGGFGFRISDLGLLSAFGFPPPFRYVATSRASDFFSLAATALALFLFTGCAYHSGPARAFPRPPSEDMRARLGTVLVESAGSNTVAQLARPDTKGKAAAKGALEGMLAVGEMPGAAVGMAAGPAALIEIALIPIGAAVGSIAGAIQGVPRAEIEEAEKALVSACRELNFQEAVRRQVIEAGRKNTRHAFRVADQPIPDSPGAAPPGSILQVDVLKAGLVGPPRRDAKLEMFLRVQVRLLRWPDRSSLYEYTWVQTSGARSFQQWAAQDARAFRQQLAAASHTVAENIVEEIFLSYRPR